jgi:hypothetical protein
MGHERTIPVEETLALMTALFELAEPEKLATAFDLYRQALLSSAPQKVLMAGEFLFISAETLGQALVAKDAAAADMSRKNLRRHAVTSGGKSQIRKYLEERVFAGDSEAYAAMEEASNGFEHGYKDIEIIRQDFVKVLPRAFGHVRRALIEATGVGAVITERLLNPPYVDRRWLEPVVMVANATIARRDTSQPVPEMVNVAPIELGFDKDIGGDWRDDGRVLVTVARKAKVDKRPDNVAVNIEAVELMASNVTRLDEPETSERSTEADAET